MVPHDTGGRVVKRSRKSVGTERRGQRFTTRPPVAARAFDWTTIEDVTKRVYSSRFPHYLCAEPLIIENQKNGYDVNGNIKYLFSNGTLRDAALKS